MTASLMAGGSPQTTRWQVGGALSQLPEAEHSMTEGPCKLGKNGYYPLPWSWFYPSKGTWAGSRAFPSMNGLNPHHKGCKIKCAPWGCSRAPDLTDRAPGWEGVNRLVGIRWEQRDIQEVTVAEVKGHTVLVLSLGTCALLLMTLTSVLPFTSQTSHPSGVASPPLSAYLILTVMFDFLFTASVSLQIPLAKFLTTACPYCPFYLNTHTHIHPCIHCWSNQPHAVLRNWALALICFLQHPMQCSV